MILIQVHKDGLIMHEKIVYLIKTFSVLPESIFSHPTCSVFEVTLDLLQNNQPVKLFGDLGMATINRSVTVGPRKEYISLHLIGAKPRELTFYITGNSLPLSTIIFCNFSKIISNTNSVEFLFFESSTSLVKNDVFSAEKYGETRHKVKRFQQ